jgi:hypothetical protein
MRGEGAQFLVWGQGQIKQYLKASIDLGESEVSAMVKAVLTPSHPNPFEALLDQPCACTLYDAGTQRLSQGLIRLIIDMLAMPLQIGIRGRQGVSCGRQQPLDV